ncbi:MAG TPA: SRPBCC family protein [Kofleriaceae bacterium]|nr:SRPBCC family protein [Kofleriaceae bacterium]
MVIALYIVAGVLGLVLAMALVGALLPRGHVAARRATLDRPLDEVWRALADLDAMPRWRRGVIRIERLSPTAFREHSSHGAITFAIEVDDPPRRRVTRIADDKLPFGGAWIYELEPDGAGTRLAITEDGFVSNPIFRLLSRTVFSQTATLERFLVDLAAHLGVTARPEPAPPSTSTSAPPARRATPPGRA